MKRWLYHVRRREEALADGYVGPAFAREGFTHCSHASEIEESARLYFSDETDLELLRIDPRRLDVPIDVANTPRGPMPHVHGPIPADAVRARLALGDELEDEVHGTRFCLFAFEGMTLLDLAGVHDPVRRIATMGFDPTSTCTITGPAETVYAADGMTITVDEVLAPLDDVDVLILAGGPQTRDLQKDERVLAWLRSYPANRLLATVCTGSLLAAAAGRLTGRRAATHASARDELAAYGVTVETDRVVHDHPNITAGGVTSGIDLGLYLVERIAGQKARDAISARMEVP